MIPRILFLLLAIALTSVRGLAQEAEEHPEFRFLISFPEKPTYTHTKTALGGGEVEISMLRCVKDGVNYMMFVSMFTPKMPRSARESQFRMAKETILARPGVVLKTEEKIQAGAHDGRRFVFEEEGKTRIEQRQFIIEGNLHTISVGVPWGADMSTATSAFFGSLRSK
jgi:hypothetical protein